METQRLVTTAATILGLTLTAARADIYLELGANKRHYQLGPSQLPFEGGELSLYLRDGNVIVAGCSGQPSLSYIVPSNTCTLGTTGFVSWGDFNRDGVSDANQYWSVSSVIPSFAVAPYRPLECSLISAPPSKLPRPLRMFADSSVTVFYDISARTAQYDIALYEMVRRYGSTRQVETAVAAGIIPASEVPTGTLNVVLTSSAIVGSPLTIPVSINLADAAGVIYPAWPEEWAENIRRTLAATPAVSGVFSVSGTGTSIVLTAVVAAPNDPTLNIAIEPGTFTSPSLPLAVSYNTVGGTVASPAAAIKQMNEEIIAGRYIFGFPSLNNPSLPVALPVTITNNVEALGSNARNRRKGFRYTSGVFDGEYYQMDPRVVHNVKWQGNDASSVLPGDQILFSILSESEDWIAFPPTVPQTPVTLVNPIATNYTMPPSFFHVGDEGVMQVQFQRSLAVSNIAYDRSWRQFRVKTRWVNSYPGFVQESFPLGTPGDTSPYGDFDRDGMSNIEEYAYEFPSQADLTAAAKAQFAPGITNIIGLTQEFSRLITRVPAPVAFPEIKPDGPIGPELDEDGYIVYKVPMRANAGTSLAYDFVELTVNNRGKVRQKKINFSSRNSPWEVVVEDGETLTVPVMIEVKVVDSLTREVSEVLPLNDPLPVTVTQQFLTLRSKQPVTDPEAPLPQVGVVLRPVALQR